MNSPNPNVVSREPVDPARPPSSVRALRRPGRSLRASAAVLLGFTLALPASAQSGAAHVPKQSDRPLPLESEEPGFVELFDGRSLEGWSGDPVYWRVEDGVIVGEVTPETLLKSNTFIVWQGGEPRDFELKLEYRISRQGNSGINYRSVLVEDTTTPTHRFALRGYQCDLDGLHRYTGNNYEERGRLFLAERGQLTRVTGNAPPSILSTLGDTSALVRELTDGWNSVHLIARGPLLIHTINGRVMAVVYDDDPSHPPSGGRIGMQVHVGPPMKVEFRRIRLKTLDP